MEPIDIFRGKNVNTNFCPLGYLYKNTSVTPYYVFIAVINENNYNNKYKINIKQKSKISYVRIMIVFKRKKLFCS